MNVLGVAAPALLNTGDGATSDCGEPLHASMVSVAVSAIDTRRCCGTDTQDRGAIATIERFMAQFLDDFDTRGACTRGEASSVPPRRRHSTSI
jgi:hypothetical protein